MPTTYRPDHPGLARHLAELDRRSERRRAIAITVCFFLPAMLAIAVALASLAISPDPLEVAPTVVSDLELEAVSA